MLARRLRWIDGTAASHPAEEAIGTMPPITLTVEARDAAIVEGLLLKLRAGELAELRRVQSQLSVYDDRRASMAGEPVAIEARIALLDDLIAQLKAQRP